MVEVRIPTVLRQAVGGNATINADGETVGDILESLSEKYPAFGLQVLTKSGELHKFVNVYVNDDDVRYLQRLETKVSSDDSIAILPAVAGGAI